MSNKIKHKEKEEHKMSYGLDFVFSKKLQQHLGFLHGFDNSSTVFLFSIKIMEKPVITNPNMHEYVVRISEQKLFI